MNFAVCVDTSYCHQQHDSVFIAPKYSLMSLCNPWLLSHLTIHKQLFIYFLYIIFDLHFLEFCLSGIIQYMLFVVFLASVIHHNYFEIHWQLELSTCHPYIFFGGACSNFLSTWWWGVLIVLLLNCNNASYIIYHNLCQIYFINIFSQYMLFHSNLLKNSWVWQTIVCLFIYLLHRSFLLEQIG